MRSPLPIALLAACVHHAPAAPPGGGSVVYDVAVLTASGDRQVTALYTLELTPRGGRTWTTRTLHTAGTVLDAGGVLAFDSETPAQGDPWPLLLQHAVAAVPAAIRFDARGAPDALIDAEAWASAARVAVEALGLPAEARTAGEQLLDPDGLVADLRRTFPGTPPQGEWKRSEHLGGVSAVRNESCSVQDDGALETWTCTGWVEGEDGPFRLLDAMSSTIVVADARGLVSHESAWSGTLMWLDGDVVHDVPAGGRRLARRR